MDKSLEAVMGEVSVPVVDPLQQGPCIPDSGRIDAVDLGKLAKLQKDSEEQQKIRTYWFVIWPESVNLSLFFQVLRDSGYSFAISPLHDKDVKDFETGELDKPHYHVIVRFPTPRYLEPVRRLVGSWLYDADGMMGKDADGKDATWYVRPVPDYAKALRYLCHIDTPEKHRYPENEVMSIGFIDLSMLYAKSLSEDMESYMSLIAWCRQNPTKTYADLMDAVFAQEDKALMRVLTRYSYTLKGYIADRSSRKKHGA